jgi:hypothetical protein
MPLCESRVDHIRLSSMMSETTEFGISPVAQLRLNLTAPEARQRQLNIRMEPFDY